MYFVSFIISIILSFLISLYLKNKYIGYNLNKINIGIIIVLDIIIYLILISKFNNSLLININMSCFMYILYSIISSSLATSFVIDVLFKELPDENNLIIGISLFMISAISMNFKVIITSVIMFIVFFIVSVMTNQFGMGDVKMMAMMGLGLNPYKIVPFIFTSCLLAVIYSCFKIIVIKNNKDTNIAFGPFLIVSFLIII